MLIIQLFQSCFPLVLLVILFSCVIAWESVLIRWSSCLILIHFSHGSSTSSSVLMETTTQHRKHWLVPISWRSRYPPLQRWRLLLAGSSFGSTESSIDSTTSAYSASSSTTTNTQLPILQEEYVFITFTSLTHPVFLPPPDPLLFPFPLWLAIGSGSSWSPFSPLFHQDFTVYLLFCRNSFRFVLHVSRTE